MPALGKGIFLKNKLLAKYFLYREDDMTVPGCSAQAFYVAMMLVILNMKVDFPSLVFFL